MDITHRQCLDSGRIPRYVLTLISLTKCSDGIFEAGKAGCISILATGDRKVEFINFEDHTLAFVRSAMGYPAYYPVPPVHLQKPVRAVLMDLDGTTVRSEEFWISMIQMTIASLLGDPTFSLEEADLPFVSGHSVSEHLPTASRNTAPGKPSKKPGPTTSRTPTASSQEILQGRGRPGAFKPAPGVKEFLLELKQDGGQDRTGDLRIVRKGLARNPFRLPNDGVWEIPVISMMRSFQPDIRCGKGSVGTLGELSPKPHPWLYAETFRVGLGMNFEDRHSVVGIEDSGAGICSIRLAGITAIGIAGGNIIESGTRLFMRPLLPEFRGNPEHHSLNSPRINTDELSSSVFIHVYTCPGCKAGVCG